MPTFLSECSFRMTVRFPSSSMCRLHSMCGVEFSSYVVVERVQSIFCHEQHSVGAIAGNFRLLSYQPLGDFRALPYGEFCGVVGWEGAVKRPVRKGSVGVQPGNPGGRSV